MTGGRGGLPAQGPQLEVDDLVLGLGVLRGTSEAILLVGFAAGFRVPCMERAIAGLGNISRGAEAHAEVVKIWRGVGWGLPRRRERVPQSLAQASWNGARMDGFRALDPDSPLDACKQARTSLNLS